MAEAVSQHADFIVTYSPMPHSPLMRLSTDDVMGRILLQCAKQQLAVHCIHSSADAAVGGINDWLARSLSRGSITPIVRHPRAPEAGQGRLLDCDVATPLSAIVERLKELLQLRCAHRARKHAGPARVGSGACGPLRSDGAPPALCCWCRCPQPKRASASAAPARLTLVPPDRTAASSDWLSVAW
jgi:putative NIF3 family GTP cyclohydrolase 1 type 2